MLYSARMASRVQSVLGYVFLDLVGSVLRFPIWWYTTGLMGTVRWVGRSLAFRWRSYDIALWIRFFFVPMYGSYDWTGRFVSVIMRFAVIVARMIGFAVETVCSLLLLVLWVIALPTFLWFFLRSLFP